MFRSIGLTRFVALILLATTAMSCAGIARRGGEPTLRWIADSESPGQATVEARGADWEALLGSGGSSADAGRASEILRVYTGKAPATAGLLPPMLGDYDLKDGMLRFRPRFPLEPGVRYTAVLDLSTNRSPLNAAYVAPARPDAPPTVVSRVYPSAAELPENLLKFYVHFSAPMSRGDVYQHVRLIDEAAGREVDIPFLELEEELWNPAMTRLTLFIDPGRIKRGVRPLEEVGPALELGKRYTLLIDRHLVDAGGRALDQDFRKSFTVGPPLREPPDPAKWEVARPTASTHAPLAIDFPHPMDHALAERLILVTTAAGRVVPGETSLGDAERHWTFTPDEPWAPGRYEIIVQPTVEDLAGNNVGKLFEVDLEDDAEGRPDLSPVRLPVEVR